MVKVDFNLGVGSTCYGSDGSCNGGNGSIQWW